MSVLRRMGRRIDVFLFNTCWNLMVFSHWLDRLTLVVINWVLNFDLILLNLVVDFANLLLRCARWLFVIVQRGVTGVEDGVRNIVVWLS